MGGLSSTGRRLLLGGSSLAALLAAAPAAAQIGSPGSAQCPIVAGTVTCTGDISDGFRSDNNPDMRILTFIALTQPIAPPPGTPVIEVRTANNLTMTLDATTVINATRPFSSFSIATGRIRLGTEVIERPSAAVALVFDRAASAALNLRNDGRITTGIDPRGDSAFYHAGIVADGAATVELTNTGAISTRALFDSNFLYQINGIRVDHADRINLANSGRIEAISAGTFAFSNGYHAALDLRARLITVTNTGELASDGPNSAPFILIGQSTATAAASINLTNSGTIVRGTDSAFNDPFSGATDTNFGLIGLLGSGSVEFRNSGMLGAAADLNRTEFDRDAVRIDAVGTAAGQSQSILFDNLGTIFNGNVEILVSRQFNSLFDTSSTSTFDRYDGVPRVVTDAASLSVSNGGTLRNSTITASLTTQNSANVTAINTGAIDGGGFDLVVIRGQSTSTFSNSANVVNAHFGLRLFGVNSTLTFENTGNLTSREDALFRDTILNFGLDAAAARLIFRNSGNLTSSYGFGILLEGDSIDAVNTGTLSMTGNNSEFGFPYGIGASQGTRGSPTNFNAEARSGFDQTNTVRNDGAITINYNILVPSTDQTGSFAIGIGAAGSGDVLVTNTGRISVTGGASAGPLEIAGILLDGYSDVTLTNSAPLSLDIVGDDPVSAAIAFFERSQGQAQVDADIASHVINGPYDRASDVNSRIRIATTADVTASGRNAIGIGGVLGLSDVSHGERDYSGDLEGFIFENDQAAAFIDIPLGITVTGGSGGANAVNVQGIGSVTIDNRGAIIGRGDAGSGAVVIGGTLITGFGSEGTSDPLPALPTDRFINLVDMVNSGTIRSDNGYGIRAVEGSITNLVNRGLVFGGQGSLAAARASTASNEAAGTLDGRLALLGAGSRLDNAGSILVSTPGAVTHQINGNFVQSATGALLLRNGDHFNASGNFALNGDLNLALGAPTLAPVFTVGGNLTLDGRLNVTDAGGFGEGVYRLFDYGGALTDNGLALSALPGGASGTIQTAIANQVNLVVGGADPGPGPAPAIQFWDGTDTVADGTIDGGTATWNNVTTNWTRAAGDVNDPWGSRFAVFQAAPGTVTIDSAGVSASGLQFAVGGYTIAGGPLTLTAPATLRVGDGSAAGAGYTATIASAIGGAGGIDKTDLGILILTGTNGYAGGTRVSSGVLQVSADNALGAAAGGVTLDGGTLRAGGAFSTARGFTIGGSGGTLDTGANALTLSGALGGTGALTKAGSGTLTLSGNSASYGGTMTLAGGALSLSGTLGGTLQVNAGTRLSGTGTLGNLVLAGTLAPGNSIGTLSATGNVIIRAGATVEVEVAAAGGTDLLAAAGTATIEGGTVRVAALDPETQYVNGRSYTFLTAAGGRTGSFAGLSESSAFLDFALGYTATSAFLTVSVVRTFPDVALTFNQRQASTALAALAQTPGSDSLAVYNQILLLDGDAARAAFDASSGEIYPVLVAADLRRSAGLAGRFMARGQAVAGEGWGLWGGASGHDGRTDGDGNGARYSHDGLSAELGVDYRGAGNAWAVGIGGGYDDGDATLRDRGSRGEADGWHLGGYARYGDGGAGFTATLGGAWAGGKADVTRNIAFGTLARTATARVDLDSWALGGELRYGFALGGGWSLGPQARLIHAEAELGTFAETGAGSLNLSGGDGNDDSRTRYGGGLFARWQGLRGSVDAALSWLRGGRAPTELGLVMTGAPATPYRVRSARGDGDSAAFTLAGQLDLGRGWSLGANVDAAFGSRERNLQGNATLGWRF